MAITGTAIASKVRHILQDEGSTKRWLDSELVDWINTAQAEVVAVKPSASVSTSSVQLVAGTRQSITGLVLVDVIRNMGTDGTAPGLPINLISRESLDSMIPNWHSTAGASQNAIYFTYNPANPKVFYVYPPRPSGTPGYVELAQSVTPTKIANLSDNITLDDIYEGAIIDYVCYRCFQKDDTVNNSVNRAQAHYSAFGNTLGSKAQAEVVNSPAGQHSPPPPKQGNK